MQCVEQRTPQSFQRRPQERAALEFTLMYSMRLSTGLLVLSCLYLASRADVLVPKTFLQSGNTCTFLCCTILCSAGGISRKLCIIGLDGKSQSEITLQKRAAAVVYCNTTSCSDSTRGCCSASRNPCCIFAPGSGTCCLDACYATDAVCCVARSSGGACAAGQTCCPDSGCCPAGYQCDGAYCRALPVAPNLAPSEPPSLSLILPIVVGIFLFLAIAGALVKSYLGGGGSYSAVATEMPQPSVLSSYSPPNQQPLL